MLLSDIDNQNEDTNPPHHAEIQDNCGGKVPEKVSWQVEERGSPRSPAVT